MSARRPQQTSALLELLSASKVEFAVIGGVAAVLYGSARMTLDLDIVTPFSAANLTLLLETLRPYDPRHATRPDLSILEDSIEHLLTFRMLLIETQLGRLDALPGVEPYGDYTLVPTREQTLFGHVCRVIELDALIEVKRLAGRRKDIEVVFELEALRARTQR
ncbi:hypothetical protein DB30_07098 [Enhygromyxa salina]|uniref:Nucleotidyltransferase n=1 Tax=Enhygromyxa salina TaxID=215803 RepID=A0A0C2D1R2_9BACT|nr:hypothetical protein [Enhygromyxa salina]KIG14102.1 hypothetical protein DB30_07098 [Enhygromyxa salina]